MNKYRVVSVQYVDVFASDEDEAMALVGDHYNDLDENGRDDLRTVTLSWSFDKGLSQDQLVSLGVDLDDEDTFSPVNDPF